MGEAALAHQEAVDSDTQMFVTMRLGSQLFGITVEHVRDVLLQQKVTAVPLAPPEISGSLNLRGRIVTVIDLRHRLKLPPGDPNMEGKFVVVEFKNELYSLIVDNVGEVLTLPKERIEKPPANLSGNWKNVASGIYKLDEELLVLIDVQTLLKL